MALGGRDLGMLGRAGLGGGVMGGLGRFATGVSVVPVYAWPVVAQVSDVRDGCGSVSDVRDGRALVADVRGGSAGIGGTG